MKNIFKFAAMAFAAVVLAGGATSCDNKDEKEPLTIDGKQWIYIMESEYEGVVTKSGLFTDLGVNKKGILSYGYVDPETFDVIMGTSMDPYTINTIDETSGSIDLISSQMTDENGDPMIISFKYTELTKNSVKIDVGIVMGGMPMEQMADFTIAPKTLEYTDLYDQLPDEEEEEM